MEPIDRIDRYLSGELSPDETRQLEQDLARNADLRQLLEGVRITQRAVQIGNIRGEVRQAQALFTERLRQEPDEEAPETANMGRVIPMPNSRSGRVSPFGWVTRIAAGVLLLLVGFAGYQAATLDGQNLYDEKNINYRLGATRSSGEPPSLLEDRYRTGDYAGVIRQGASLSARKAPDWYLMAMAHLRQNQFEQAVEHFEQARVANQAFVNRYYEPETDYYLGLAYLGAGQYDKAYQTWKPIRDDAEHSYHDLISQTDLWKLEVLDWFN